MKIEMPRGWEQVSIKKYQKLQKLLQAQEGQNTGLDVLVQVAAVLAGVEEDVINQLDVKDWTRLEQGLGSWVNQEPRFDTKYSIKKIILNDKTYLVQDDVEKWSTAQYIDFQQMVSKPELLTNLLACILIPKGYDKYNTGYDALEVAKELEDLSITVAMSVQFFFLKRWASSMKATATCLAHRRGKTKEETKLIQKMGREMKQAISTMCGCQWYQQYLTQQS